MQKAEWGLDDAAPKRIIIKPHFSDGEGTKKASKMWHDDDSVLGQVPRYWIISNPHFSVGQPKTGSSSSHPSPLGGGRPLKWGRKGQEGRR